MRYRCTRVVSDESIVEGMILASREVQDALIERQARIPDEYVRGLAFSPDGKLVAFVGSPRSRASYHADDLYVVEMSGSGMPVIGVIPIVMPTFTNTWKRNATTIAPATVAE